MMKQVARWAVLIPLFIIPFLSLYVSDHLFFPFITGKGFAFRILVEIALAGWAYLALIDTDYRPKFSWTMVLYGALVVWMIVADALAVNPHKAFWSNYERMDGFVTLAHVFVLFVVMGAFLSAEKRWRQWWLAYLAGAALASLYGLLQMMGVLAIHQGGVRLDATLGNSEYYAAYLLFTIAIALWQGIESRGWLRYALWVLAVLDVVLLFATQTRAAAVALAAAAVAGAALWAFESGKQGRRAAAGVLVALLVVIGGFVAMRHSSFVENSPALSRIADITPASLSVRFMIWDMAWQGFEARPVAGWGQEGFNYVFNAYYNPAMYAQESWFDRAHNTFLDWLIAGGLPAFLLFGALFLSVLVALWRRSESRAERVLLVSALIAYLVQSLTVFDNLFSYIPLAAIFAYAHMRSAQAWAKVDALDIVPQGSADTIAAPIIGVALVLVLWFVNVPSLRAADDLIKALGAQSDPATAQPLFQKALDDGGFGSQEIREQLISFAASADQSQGVDAATKQSVTTFAVDQMKQELARAPQDTRLWLQLAMGYRAAGDYTDALTASGEALKLSPKKQGILFERGAEQESAGDYKGAQESFEQAYQLDTSYDEAASYAAAGDIFVGDLAGGKALLLQHFGTTTVDSNALALAYYQTKDFADLIAIWQLRVANADSAQNRFGLAAAYVAAGDLAAARATVEAAIAEFPAANAQGQTLLQELDAMQK